jgi:hypothetical protein
MAQSLNESARRKCHHDSAEITEYGTSITQHVRNGVTGEWDHNSDFGDYTGSIAVYCPECGYTGRFAQSRPKWVKKLFQEVADDTDFHAKWSERGSA